MATKKAASTAKKSTAKKPIAKKQATTKVTTIKAVESNPVHKTVAASSSTTARRFGLMRTPIVAALIAEFIGTFILAAAVVSTGQSPSLATPFILAAVILAIGTVSGGYANPALVIGAWVTRRMTGLRAIGYIVAQVLGAMLALVLMNAFAHAVPTSTESLTSSAPQIAQALALPKGHEWFIFLAEFIGTLIFGFAVASARFATAKRLTAALAYGFGGFIALIIAGSAANFLGSGVVLNPAVAISLQAINFNSVWPIGIYVIASALGAIVGFILFDLIRNVETTDRA